MVPVKGAASTTGSLWRLFLSVGDAPVLLTSLWPLLPRSLWTHLVSQQHNRADVRQAAHSLANFYRTDFRKIQRRPEKHCKVTAPEGVLPVARSEVGRTLSQKLGLA